MSTNETDGFGIQSFGDSEFGSPDDDPTKSQDGYLGFGEGGFGEQGFGGFPLDAQFAGLFGTSPFGSAPFGGQWWVEVDDEPAPSPIDDWPGLSDGTQPGGPQTARARFDAHIKSPFNTSEGTQWDKLLNTYAEEFESAHLSRDHIVTSQYVDTATGKQLDKIGSFVQLPRERDETHPHYRGRLKVQLRAQIGGGTIEDVREVSAILLDVAEASVTISENFDNEAARFDIDVPSAALSDSEISVDDFVSWLDKIRAGGVRIFGTIEGSFEHRSIEDYENGVNDPSKGYDEGVYAGILTN